jgi:nickel-type superoxide dismutase maturation protease
MYPTLSDGQIVLVNRLAYWFATPKTRDIVAVSDPRDGKILIKRITKIEGKQYFVQGDNKKASTDSRVFGMIEKSDILGKVIVL